MQPEIALFWFRRDLRIRDNVGLYHALNSGYPVLPIFIFDSEILSSLPRHDARVNFIHNRVQQLDTEIKKLNGKGVAVYFGQPLEVLQKLSSEFLIREVFTNRDYEPYARTRDESVASYFQDLDIPFRTYKDQVIFEEDEIVKDDGNPYVVYTPYMKRWKLQFAKEQPLSSFPLSAKAANFYDSSELPFLTLEQIGFNESTIQVPEYHTDQELISNYEATRNFPGLDKGTSRLGPHLRFGTVSVREMIKKAVSSENEVFWNELIWREFFMQILWHFPDTVHKAFKPQYDRIQWRNDTSEFELWKNGETGYALVDAGMRELNATGYMHNRVRMLVASFLCKHLLIDWRWGEAYFAEKLLDYEMASNVGNWQWAAGSGVDAAPYFRIFNPMTQVEKFDPDKTYINKWVPELQEFSYPDKMVDHKMARERCLRTYKEALA
ncbi:cryptochrome/photolyase family protein [Poritiphilus flavus]|uniref:Deoxyribodipyrimidine photo-lyase n=1 Tax=Poritiphilus flavus TaxID=2697053 RepID=A0A6L9EE90_9FLAO|nr:deoxyribodipyrimidine photo-lyase [Poritiphilus flavus]NAS12961.1 deoxyribodipyrimidine photo-lyase [Poritiphilus flavus]